MSQPSYLSNFCRLKKPLKAVAKTTGHDVRVVVHDVTVDRLTPNDVTIDRVTPQNVIVTEKWFGSDPDEGGFEAEGRAVVMILGNIQLNLCTDVLPRKLDLCFCNKTYKASLNKPQYKVYNVMQQCT